MSESKSIKSGPVTRGRSDAMNTIPVGKSIVDKDGLKRTVIERTGKFFKIQLGSNAGAANFQNLNEKEKGEKVYGSSASYEESEPSDELSKLSSSGQGARNGIEESEKTEESGEKSKQSSFIQRTSNEESEETVPTEEFSKQSSSGQRSTDEKSHGKVSLVGGDPENLSQSSSVQRASNEESEETEQSEELPKQSSSGQRFWSKNEESEKTEPTGELSKQSSSGEMTTDEQSNEKVSLVGGDPENLNQSGSVQRASNEESEETDPSEELPKQSSSEPTEELSKQSSSGEMTTDEQSNEKVSLVGGDPENLNQSQSGSVQRASNEESEENDPSEEFSKQSSSGQRTSNEKSNVKEKDEAASRSSISNEESEETEPSVSALYQFKDNIIRWFQSLGGGDRENSSDKEKDEDASGTTTANEVTEAEKEPLSQSSSGPEKRLKERLQETTNVVKTTTIYEVDENKTPEESTFSWKLIILIAIMLVVLFFGMLALFSSVESISTFFSI